MKYSCQPKSISNILPILIADCKEPSFFIIKVSNRNKLRKYLCDRQIYLPVHWVHNEVHNDLYQQLLSIPVFIQYTLSEIEYVGQSIRKFIDEKH